MGCASSKILARSGSYQEEVKQRLQGAKGLEELLVSNNKGDQYIALLHNASTVTKKLKEEPPKHQLPEENSSTSLNLADSESTNSKVHDRTTNSSDGLETIETIDARELLAGLEDEDSGVEGEEESQQQMHNPVEGTSTAGLPSTNLQNTEEDKYIVSNELVLSKTVNANKEKLEDDVSSTQSIHTEEDYDNAKATGTDLDLKHVNSEPESIHLTSNDTECVASESDTTSKKLSKRASMAKELGVLRIPSTEFSKSGSLRDWLLQGGLVVTPGSPITPKFGEFVSAYAKDRDALLDTSIFDPELVAQFEQAMKKLTMEEENILTQILADLGGANDEDLQM